MAPLVDWDLAVATARRLAPPGPQVSAAEAGDSVAELRRLAAEADGHVRAYTRLAGVDGASPPATVVDRPGWVAANVAGFRTVLEPLLDALAARRPGPVPPLTHAVGSRLTGAQLGALLAYLSTRVLGQYEIFLPPGQGEGRLTLVAPNIVAAERALGADPRDFRMWVCLHESAHRLQFTAVPWLRAHLLAELETYLDASDLDPAALLRRLRAGLTTLLDSVRGRGEASLLEAVQTPRQREILDRITALMSLLEGHSDAVMDGVGPLVVPTVADIRRRFDARRQHAGGWEAVVRRLLGVEAKLRQYAEGGRFVREAVTAVGMDGFNRVWTSPDTLPTLAEIQQPAAWVARVGAAGA